MADGSEADNHGEAERRRREGPPVRDPRRRRGPVGDPTPEEPPVKEPPRHRGPVEDPPPDEPPKKLPPDPDRRR